MLYFGAKAVIAGDLSVGSLVAFNMLAGRVAAPILRLSQLWQDFQQVRISVDRLGETALLYFNGSFSHAIAKGAMLRADADEPRARSVVTARTPGDDELALAQRALAAAAAHLGRTTPFLYARVDLIHDSHGSPRLLELELAEPSLFFAQAPGSAARFAEVLLARARLPVG